MTLEPNREFVNGDDKKIGRKGTALADTSLRRERRRRLTIHQDRESGGRDARSNEANEVGVEPKASESRGNEFPVQPIKGFSKIKFEEESLLVPSLEGKGVNNFLGDNNVGRNVHVLNKSSLGLVNVGRVVGI